MNNILTSVDVLGVLRRECSDLGTQKAWAEKHGVSPAYVNDLLQGRREISDNVADMLGYERRVIFTKRLVSPNVHNEREHIFP